MEGARSGLLRLPLAAAEQAAALAAEKATTLIVIVGIPGPAARSVLGALHPREQAGAGGLVGADEKSRGQTSGDEDAPASQSSLQIQHLAAPRPLRLLSLLNYRRFALTTLVPMIPELCRVIRFRRNMFPAWNLELS